MSKVRVSCTKPPKGLEKIVSETSKLMETILNELGYENEWHIVFRRQQSKKEEFKFQLLRREGAGIVARTKPGDNGTCWEILIIPPQGLTLGSVYEDLRRVHPKKLFIPRPIRDDNKLIPEIFKPPRLGPLDKLPIGSNLPSSIPSIDELLKPKYEIANTRPIEPEPEPIPVPVVEAPKPVAPAPTPPTPIPAPVHVPVIAPIPAPIATNVLDVLKLDPAHITGKLQENPIAIEHGLLALGIVANEIDGHVLRAVAMGTLIATLDLVSIVRVHPGYQRPFRAASGVAKGLCGAGYFTRWNCRPSKKKSGSRVRETTKGFIITPSGRAKLEELKKTSNYPPALFEKLYSGIEGVDLSNIDSDFDTEFDDEVTTPTESVMLPVAPIPQPETKVESQNGDPVLSKISARMSDLNPLIQRHDEISGMLTEYQNEIIRCRTEKENKDKLVLGCQDKINLLKTKLVELQREIDGVQKDLTNHETQKVKLDQDLVEYEGMCRSDTDELNKILVKIRAILQ